MVRLLESRLCSGRRSGHNWPSPIILSRSKSVVNTEFGQRKPLKQRDKREMDMHHGHRPATSARVPATLVPETGWHFLHLFYRIDRQRLRACTDQDRRDGRDELTTTLLARSPGALEQLQ